MKAMFETPCGDWYALPADDRCELQRMLAKIARVRKLDWDHFAYAGPVCGEFFTLPPENIEGLPAHLADAPRRRNLKWWYLGSLSLVSYVVSVANLPPVLDTSVVLAATVITMWLHDRGLI